MKFIQRGQFASTYQRSNGTTVLLVHGTATKHDYDDHTIGELWALFTPPPGGDAFAVFRDEFLAPRLEWPTDAADLDACTDCDQPATGEDFFSTGPGGGICQGCRDDGYFYCEDCDDLEPDARCNSIFGGNRTVCDYCLEHNYGYCDECQDHYDNDDGCDGEHSGCSCEARHQHFTLGGITSDTRATVSLPAGEISDVGLGSIAAALRVHADHVYTVARNAGESVTYDSPLWATVRSWNQLSYDLADRVGQSWQTKRGNFTKRLSREAHATHGLKIPAELLANIGNLARDHSKGADVELELTRDLNQSAADFYHEDSCWWQSYAYSRCALKTHGGLGLRTFDADGGGVSGRAWVMPLDADLQPTSDTATPAAFVVFNGYGELEGYAPARIVAQLAGMTYRRIGLGVVGMYINNDAGYLVAPEALAASTAQLSLTVAQHRTRTPAYA